MLNKILKLIEDDLDQVDNFIDRELPVDIGLVKNFAGFEFSQADLTIRPALVILSSRLYSGDSGRAVALACVFQFAYMAFRAHDSVAEHNSVQRRDPGLLDDVRFPVLLGDYLYSKSYSILTRAGITGMLGYLAEIISQISQGGILKRRLSVLKPTSQSFYEIIRKESAEFFAGCCRLGARLAGAPESKQEILHNFGHNLGMAYGLQEYGINFEQRAVYMEEAMKYLSMLPNRPEREAMGQLVSMCAENEVVLRCQVG
ncbi:MAG: polyprenyl synthetase family protein [Desulfotomaculaceae bacterium]|nr:polyprenyl synthetase family protein [Desulfotomaculaceae bacterium]